LQLALERHIRSVYLSGEATAGQASGAGFHWGPSWSGIGRGVLPGSLKAPDRAAPTGLVRPMMKVVYKVTLP
jgi:hypothetical protein